jgi:hypothetical protein
MHVRLPNLDANGCVPTSPLLRHERDYCY